MESDSCEKRLRAHDTFLHLTDLFVDSNRLHQWRKPKDNQIDSREVSVASLPLLPSHFSSFGCEAHSMPKAVSLPCWKPSDLDEVIRGNRPRSPGTASTQVRSTVLSKLSNTPTYEGVSGQHGNMPIYAPVTYYDIRVPQFFACCGLR